MPPKKYISRQQADLPFNIHTPLDENSYYLFFRFFCFFLGYPGTEIHEQKYHYNTYIVLRAWGILTPGTPKFKFCSGS